MQRRDRYDTGGLEETEFEPGSRKRVLKNFLGITSKREMDRIEGQAQVDALEKLVALYDASHRFPRNPCLQSFVGLRWRVGRGW